MPSALRRSMTLRRTYSLELISWPQAAFSIAAGNVGGHRTCNLALKELSSLLAADNISDMATSLIARDGAGW